MVAGNARPKMVPQRSIRRKSNTGAAAPHRRDGPDRRRWGGAALMSAAPPQRRLTRRLPRYRHRVPEYGPPAQRPQLWTYSLLDSGYGDPLPCAVEPPYFAQRVWTPSMLPYETLTQPRE